MQGYVGVMSTETRKCRLRQPGKCRDRFIPECRKQQIEPHDVRANVVDHLQQPRRIEQGIEAPAAHHVEVRQLFCGLFELVPQNRETEQRIALQLTSDVVAVFVQPTSARRKCGDQTDLHVLPWPQKIERRKTGRTSVPLWAVPVNDGNCSACSPTEK